MAVSLGIGPDPQTITTSYTFDAGVVTIGPRDEVAHDTAALAAVVRSIKSFRSAVTATDNPAIAPPAPPLLYSAKVDQQTAGLLSCEFTCAALPGTFSIEATMDLATRITTFEERDGAAIAWGDFELLLNWMAFLASFARR